jgi:hypothetical protein
LTHVNQILLMDAMVVMARLSHRNLATDLMAALLGWIGKMFMSAGISRMARLIDSVAWPQVQVLLGSLMDACGAPRA